jgi:hypothetical protein
LASPSLAFLHRSHLRRVPCSWSLRTITSLNLDLEKARLMQGRGPEK